VRTRGARRLATLAALAALSWCGCSLLIDTDGFSTPNDVDGEASSSSDAVPDSDGTTSGDGGLSDRRDIEDAPSDAPPADVLVVGPVDAGLCPTPPNDPSLKGWYLFDDGAGSTVIDCSSSKRHGVQTNGQWKPGKKGTALAFNGTSTCVTLPAGLSMTTGFTVAAWVNVTSWADNSGYSRYIVSKTNDSDLGWRIGTDLTSLFELRLGLGIGTTGHTVQTPNGQAANTWTHVVAVYAPGARSEIWVNGSLIAAPAGSPQTFADDSNAPPRIGCRATSHFFWGLIDEVRIYDRALAPQEIPALAQ
jgi:hypothetical protein